MAFITIHSLSQCFRQKDAYSEPRQKSKMELFQKIVHGFKRLTISVKRSILDIRLGSEYSSADSNPLLIFHKEATGVKFHKSSSRRAIFCFSLIILTNLN